MIEALQNHTLQTVVLGTVVMGIVSGVLGSFAVLRKQSLLGDAISHAALPGVCLSFWLLESKSIGLIIGAALAGWVGTMLMMAIIQNTSLKKDAALGIILSVFFGFGLLLLTKIQRLPIPNKSGLNVFLFGNAATLLKEDIRLMSVIAVIVLLITWLLWKEFKLLTFDSLFAKSIGMPTQILDIALTTLIVFSIVIGLKSVGVVLMSAMIIAPASAARQWTDRLGVMVCLSGFFASVAAFVGVWISSSYDKMPTGPMIVLVISVIVLISLIFSPNRGLFIERLRHQKRVRAQRRRQIDINKEDSSTMSLGKGDRVR